MTSDNQAAAAHHAVVHWNTSASVWDVIGPPLRPSAEDLEIIQRAVSDWAGTRPAGTKRALLLGVTPEIACMSWPAATELVACDESEEMIRQVWPGDVPGRRHALRTDWLRLPVADGAMDVVIGDGSFSSLDMDFPSGHELLARSVRRVLGSDGLLVLRLYTRPETCDELLSLFDELGAGRFGTFDGFRLKLMMTMQGSRSSVVLDDVYRAWRAAAVDVGAMAALNGWRPEIVNSMLRYEGKRARYTFPTLQHAREVLSTSFEEISIRHPGYQLGDRCPVVVLRPR
jgi:SAM-dependent methyltransferase